MGIFALDERTGVVSLGIFLAVFIAHVHRTEDVCLAPMTSLFVLHRTCAVDRLDPVVATLEVRAIASLVAQAPDDDARMVAQRQHIGLVALQMHLCKVFTLRQSALTIAHAMALKISFCHEIEASLVAEVIPSRIVGIV